jgi:fructokinase
MAIPISNRIIFDNARQVIGFGESLIDLVIENGRFSFALPGGSILNTLVSLARYGASTQLITDFTNDAPGRIISKFLEEENIGSEFLAVYSEGKTALAFAELDLNRNATYSFYKDYPEKRFDNIRPTFSSEKIFIFGSFSSLQENLQPVLSDLLDKAKSAESIIFYDPNIRQHKIDITQPAYNFLLRNFSVADVVRGSDEDFQAVFGTSNADEIFTKIQPSSCKLLIVTSSDKYVELVSGRFSYRMPVPSIKVVSTIGAGDAFNAGLLASIIEQKITIENLENLSEEQTIMMLKMAIDFASEVCASNSNYINKDLSSSAT